MTYRDPATGKMYDDGCFKDTDNTMIKGTRVRVIDDRVAPCLHGMTGTFTGEQHFSVVDQKQIYEIRTDRVWTATWPRHHHIGLGVTDFTALDVGPAKPEPWLLTLTEDQFENRYAPERYVTGYRQREWSDPEDRVALLKAVQAKCCWTVMDDDNGGVCISWGNRAVNRIHNIITLLPIEDETWEIYVSL